MKTHLNQRRDYRAVQEAFEKQQIRVVGHLAQFLQVVAYVHEGGWNSDQTLFHNTPCYLVVRQGQRHCRHERRREGVKERREGVPGVAGSILGYSHRWLDLRTTRHFVGGRIFEY